MSYDFFWNAHLNGQPQQIPTGKFLAIFEKYIVNRDENAVDLCFDDGESCVVYMNSLDAGFDGMMTSSCCHEQFLQCMFELMQLGNFIFYEPDGKGSITTEPDIEKHLLPGMTESIGNVQVGADWQSFRHLIINNR